MVRDTPRHVRRRHDQADDLPALRADEDERRRDLRRTFRPHIKMKGADSFVLNEIMGHGNPKMEKVYTQVENEALVRTMELLSDWNWHKTSTSGPGKEKGVTF